MSADELWQKASSFLARRLNIEPLTCVVIVLFCVSFLLFLLCMPALCCARRRNAKPANKRKSVTISEHDPERRRLLGLMLANLDEFDTLTPLIVSPSASGTGDSSSASRPGSRRHLLPPKSHCGGGKLKDTDHLKSSSAADSAISVSRVDRSTSRGDSRPQQYSLTTSDSPPPPRRAVGGKTLIVPLTGSNNRTPTVRIPMGPPLLGTPDSRVTSDFGTTKSCATIPEDDEFESEAVEEPAEEERTNSADLLSIDRTYVSNRESNGSQRGRVSIARPLVSTWTGVPSVVPEFKLPPPTYSPPTPPWNNSPIRRVNLRPPSASNRASTSAGGTESPQSNLSSPEDSSYGMATSPVDTTGSLSDSFMMPTEIEAVRAYYAEAADRAGLSSGGIAEVSSIETDRKFALHRIEEESENEDPAGGSRVMIGGGSIASSDSRKGQVDTRRIPRSISQQLEMMNNSMK